MPVRFDWNAILDYIDRLNELDTEKVVPMTQVSDAQTPDDTRPSGERVAFAARDDIRYGLRESLPHETALNNAPDTDGTFFEVPKVIER